MRIVVVERVDDVPIPFVALRTTCQSLVSAQHLRQLHLANSDHATPSCIAGPVRHVVYIATVSEPDNPLHLLLTLLSGCAFPE